MKVTSCYLLKEFMRRAITCQAFDNYMLQSSQNQQNQNEGRPGQNVGSNTQEQNEETDIHESCESIPNISSQLKDIKLTTE